MLSCTGIHASSKSRHKNTRVNIEQTSVVYAYLRKQVFRVSLSAKCYLFKLQMCTSVLCTLMGAPERAATSFNGFRTNAGTVGIPPQAPPTDVHKGTEIHSNRKFIVHIHYTGSGGRIFCLGGLCCCCSLFCLSWFLRFCLFVLLGFVFFFFFPKV